MIPTLFLVGLVLGTWWRVVIPMAVIVSAAVLVAMGIGSGIAFVLGTALIASISVTVGVLVSLALRPRVAPSLEQPPLAELP